METEEKLISEEIEENKENTETEQRTVSAAEVFQKRNQKAPRKGIPGSTLKIIAVVTMLIDHIGAFVVARILTQKITVGIISGLEITDMDDIMTYFGDTYMFMMLLRAIGRIAFPIFCFLLVEGFQKTHNKLKYISRLAIFALISEIPFDLACYGKVMDFGYQNVYFTLLLGILMLCGLDYADKHANGTVEKYLYKGISVAACMGLAELLNTDYGAMGVVAILGMYAFRKNKIWAFMAGVSILGAFNYIEFIAMVGVIFVWLYNGKRGLKMKYFFYAFYPVHLLILWLITYFMGIGFLTAI